MKEKIETTLYELIYEVCDHEMSCIEVVEKIKKIMEEQRLTNIHYQMPVGYTSEQDLKNMQEGKYLPTLQKFIHGKHCIPLVRGHSDD